MSLSASGRRSRLFRVLLPAGLLAVGPLTVGLLAGCAGGAPVRAPATSPASVPPDPEVYVAVGASDTVGVGADDPSRESWPQVLRDSALPSSTLVNVGVPGATVPEALVSQLPKALAAEPDVVTVWLVVNDIGSLVPAKTYEGQLQTLVHALRRGGDTEVLVGNVPDLWRLPAYRACIPGSGVTGVACVLPFVPTEQAVRGIVEEFNAAIDRVARTEGAELVDLSGLGDLTGLTSGDGFHPSTAGHREVAATFQRVLSH